MFGTIVQRPDSDDRWLRVVQSVVPAGKATLTAPTLKE